jgi:hypothetical protein
MKIWTVTYNDDDGVGTDVFNTEAAAEAAAFHWTKVYWEGMRSPTKMLEDWREAFDWLCEQPGFMDSITVTEHEVQAPDHELGSLEMILIENVPDLSDGKLEINVNAVVSMGEDPGAYIQTWSWVYFDDVDQDMAIITKGGTVWYFDLFEEFMKAWNGTDHWELGTPELLEKSEGVNDAEEFMRYLDGKI